MNKRTIVRLRKLITLTIAPPIQERLLTPNSSIKDVLFIFEKISYAVPQLISNSLYRFNDIPTYSSVTSLNKLNMLTRNSKIKIIKKDFLLNIN